MALRTILNTGKRICSGIRENRLGVQNVHTNIKIAPLQRSALEEKCILVDEFDKPRGEATKKHCHLINKEGSVPLHRAFSVFLFNGKGDLLLQKRSSTKITFPGCYTNTCCSHPLAEIPGESEEREALGVRKAAQRRLNYELGIPLGEIELSDLHYLTRIYYEAMGDSCWGEHEVDYVLFAQKDVKLDPNPDEVSEIRWVSRSQIEEFVKSTNAPLTPWFKLMLEHKKLLFWWDHLSELHKIRDHSTIQRFT